MALYGFDGVVYLIGFFVAFIPVLLLIAEPCRNIGKYTLGDILAYRNHFRSAKLATALSEFLLVIIGSLLGSTGRSRHLWSEMLLRRQTGIGINEAITH